ncbi:S9 family peptidase [Terrimonas sp.]|uniref:S9 family peptidase n=1 Tax=Terrimonas sp. TaxID=1914338 RepID=UPI000D5229AE|nr:S9 family peptidase [Terrimonas sp.]PVD53021.1 S9 family peptidase [Terrimonas sp.]
MRKLFIVLIRIAFALTCIVANLSINAQDKKILTSADYDRAVSKLGFKVSEVFAKQDINIQWLPDGRLWFKTPGESSYTIIDPKKNKKSIATGQPAAVNSNNPRINRTGSLVTSPDGKKGVFIKDWNLWVKDIETGKEKQLTTDGVKDFGYATDNAGWKHSNNAIVLWSPDSKKIATFQQDQRHVKDMYLVRTKVGSPELEQWKYPLPGDSAIIKIHRLVIDVESGAMVRFKMPADDRRGTLCDDIACSGNFDDNQWTVDGKQLAFVSVSRDHKIATFRIANTQTGDINTIFQESVATQYESGQGAINWKYLPETNEVIWYSERDGWGHLYMYDAVSGNIKHQITKGDFVVTRMLSANPKNKQIIFEAKGKEPGENPYYSHFYKIDFNGKNLISLTPAPGDHSISFSPDSLFIIDKYSTVVTPPVTELRNIHGKIITALGKTDIKPLIDAGWVAPEIFTVKSANAKYDLYGLLYRPSQFEPGKKYPVVVYIYPGPQGGSVSSWSFRPMAGDFQALAELGFIVMRLEGSCNPDRSKAFHDECYGDMSVNTLPDQVAGLKQLAEKYSYIDLDRVGIWGHSGGGFATAAAMFRYPDFFKVGISESGNHDNRNYEDDWGERYIGLLNGDNYEKQANQVYAKNLKGKLLIVHGGMDDNVPPYNAYLVVDALVKANKDFDLLIFPNARHGFGADSYYMMRRRWDYFVQHLLNAVPPKEYKIERR